MVSKEHNNAHGSKWNPVAVGIISAILGSSGGIALVFNSPFGQKITRPDPYTGTQAATLNARVEHLEDDITEHLVRHPDEINQFDRRIATLEAQYAMILQNQARMLDRLERL